MWYRNSNICIILLKQTRVSPLSLFYLLLLQIHQAVNRLQSIRQEPYFHNRVGVKNIFAAALCMRLSKQELLEKGTACVRRTAHRLYIGARMGKRNS